MAINIMKLRAQAKALGIKGDVLTSGSRSDLEKAIAKVNGSGSAKPVVKKRRPKTSASAPVKKRGPGRPRKTETEAPKRKPGRPRKTEATAAAPKKRGRPPKAGNSSVGRATIGKIDYTVESNAWNPRHNTPVDRIFRSLKKHRDNAEKVFTELASHIKEWNLVSSKKADGSRRSKGEMEAMLRYRINRTRFEFATRTGQHKKGTKRVKYGEGDYASSGNSKPAAAPRKKSANGRRKRKTASAR